MNRSNNNSQVVSFSSSTTQFWTQPAGLILVAVAYWAAVRLGLLFVAQPEGVASIWPASGLALAVLLLSPKRQWAKLLAVIFITNTLGNWSGGNSLPVSLGFALANMLEMFLGAWALIYFCGSRITFGRTLEIFALFGVAIISNAITAVLGAAVAALAFGAPFMNTWLIWWASDGLGMILVTPLIVTWAVSQNVLQSASPRRLIEAVLLTTALIVFAWLLFGPFTVAEKPILRNYMLFPILIWLAFRYSPRGMAGVLILLAGIAVWNTLHGYGIFAFANQDITDHLISVQILLSVIAFSGLFLSAVLTDLKQSEESLRESEDKFKYVFDNSTVGKSLTLPSGEMNANQALCDMFGYTKEELQNKKWQEITHPDDIELTQREIDQLLSGEQNSVRFNKRYIHKNRSAIWVDLSSAIRRDKDGKPLYLMTSVIDITERKRMEEQTSQAAEAFSTVFQESAVALALTNIEDGTILDVNEQWLKLTGFRREDVMGESAADHGGWKNLEDRAEMRRALKEHGEVRDWEATCIKQNGEEYIVMLSAKTVTLHEKPVLLSSTIDITERKQVEERIRQSEERFRLLFDKAPLGYQSLDSDGNFIDVNQAWLDTLGYSRDEVLGRWFGDFLAPDFVKGFRQRFPIFKAAGQIHSEFEMLHKNGNRLFISFEGRIGYDLNGDFKQTHCILQDITERVIAEEKIRQLNAELEQRVEERTLELRDAQEQLVRNEKLAVLGQLAGSVGHELRNPLAVINNAIYFLKLVGADSNEKVKEYLGIIESETRTAEKIITDLLDFARIKSLDPEPVSVSVLIGLTLERFPAPPTVDVTLEIPADLPQVFVDPRQMLQVLGNLITNACQSMVSTNLTSNMLNERKLTVSAIAQGDMIRIEVHDTGVGIPLENMTKIFEPLFTTKAKGIGLGLAVSQKLTEANGGRIEVQSEAGKGSIFTVYLPVKVEEHS